MAKLTALQVAKAKNRGLISDGGGLYLQITARGSKSWIYRYRANGRLRDHGLGSVNILSLAEARDAALECRKLRLHGIDPIDAKKKRRVAAQLDAAKAMTFADCATAYIQAHTSGWKNAKHAAQWTSTIETYANPVFGDLPVAEVDVGLVLKVIEPIWVKKFETAKRVRGRVENILDWAKVRGYRTGENPARLKGNLSHLLPAYNKINKVKHHAALPHAEVAGFYAALCKQSGMEAKALQFVILTATRKGEVLGAKWDEIDFKKAVWTIPAERMKMASTHRVPLSPKALALLKELHTERSNDYVFAGTKPNSPISEIAAILKRMDRKDITVHGFRSSFRDWCADLTDVQSEVAEMALAHTISSKVEAAYRRGDLFEKRKLLMNDWAAYCSD